MTLSFSSTESALIYNHRNPYPDSGYQPNPFPKPKW